MFRLAHISDVHLGPLPALTFLELFSKRITGFVNWHRNRRRHLFANTLDIVLDDIERRDPDHLAITGDLVNLASSPRSFVGLSGFGIEIAGTAPLE